MNIWILTIGSSDVQLKLKDNWTKLFREGRRQLQPDRGFRPDPIPDSDRFRVHSRVMGVTYSQPQASLDDLDFPLIDNFINKLKAQKITIDQIILVLSDQSVFPVTKRSQKHPYWQDTCTLQPILEQHLAKRWKDISPEIKIEPLLLEAQSEEEGLDNWDTVLKLVQEKFASPSLDFSADTTIYVSHQAGTPAISSAVQFCSLAKFGKRVKFLVSNEYNPTFPEKPLEGSSYLRGIRIQEAKALLNSHNYAGVKDLIESYLEDERHQKTKILLEAAIQWNFAKFDEFANELQELSNEDLAKVVKERSQTWWWIAYESAYLAILRFEQKNTVDALFHGFRAIEGAFSDWGAKHQLTDHIQVIDDRPWLQPSILEEVQYFERAKYKCKGDEVIPDNDIAKLKDRLLELQAYERDGKKKQGLILYGLSLYPIFREVRKSWKSECKSIGRFWDNNNGISEKRNRIFHQLQGLTESELFEIWEVENYQSWKERLRIYLNYITGEFAQSLDQIDSDGNSASLMTKVHQELVEAIAHL